MNGRLNVGTNYVEKLFRITRKGVDMRNKIVLDETCRFRDRNKAVLEKKVFLN